MKNLVVIILCLGFALITFAQNTSCSVWSNQYGDSLNNKGSQMIYNPIYQAYNWSSTRENKSVIGRLDMQSNMIWTTEIDSAFAVNKMVIAPNGDILLFSYGLYINGYANNSISITRIDGLSGAIIWHNIYDENMNNYGYFRFVLEITPSQYLGKEAYIVACQVTVDGTTDIPFFMSVDGMGTINWTKVLVTNSDFQLYDIASDGNNGVGFIGDAAAFGWNSVFGRIDANGNILTTVIYGLNFSSLQLSRIQPITNGFIIGGRAASNNVFIMRIDNMGNPVYANTYTGTSAYKYNTEIVATPIDEVYVSNKETNSQNDYLLKFDASGNISYAKSIPNYLSINTVEYGNGNILLAGTKTINPNMQNDVWLATLTDSSLLSCMTNLPLTTQSMTLTPSLITIITDTFPVNITTINISTPIVYQQMEVCAPIKKCNLTATINTTVFNCQVNYNANIMGCCGQLIYSWDFGATASPSSSSLPTPSITYSSSGIHTTHLYLTCYNNDGTICQDSMIYEVITDSCNVSNTAITDLSYSSKITGYPNPATTFLTLESPLFNHHQIEITLWDMQGKSYMLTSTEKIDISENQILIHLPPIPSGIYYIEVKSPEQPTVRHRFIKE